MKTVLIIHGITGHAGIHWQGWLADEVKKAGYKVLMPEMPEADHPSRKKWLQTIKNMTSEVDLSQLVVVGHSLGVTTALDFIETANKKVHSLYSVSGFSDDYGAELNSYFLADKEIDFDRVNENLEKAFVIYGDDDPYVPQESLSLLADDLKVKPIVYKKGGHINTTSGYEKFPELLKLITE